MIATSVVLFSEAQTFQKEAESWRWLPPARVEGVEPFRNEVVIATKFGWNIDQETGERRPA
ncbi:hypothetical protein [Mesorhizobium sp. AA22]|uniref:hypothetical protein n=1 Tax=Mesorhizobium sp. AA22 TaxID=1854057 RepID=UPI000A5FB285|nr:hypothetical protein [Mesorhizobium sp. AA22]